MAIKGMAIGTALLKAGLVPNGCRNVEILIPGDGILTIRYDVNLNTEQMEILGRTLLSMAQMESPINKAVVPKV